MRTRSMTVWPLVSAALLAIVLAGALGCAQGDGGQGGAEQASSGEHAGTQGGKSGASGKTASSAGGETKAMPTSGETVNITIRSTDRGCIELEPRVGSAGVGRYVRWHNTTNRTVTLQFDGKSPIGVSSLNVRANAWSDPQALVATGTAQNTYGTSPVSACAGQGGGQPAIALK